MMKTCLHCDTPFTAQRSTAKYCSGACKTAAVRARAASADPEAQQATPPRRADPARVVKTPAGPDFEVGAGLAGVVREYLDGAPDGPTKAQALLLAGKLEQEQNASGAAALSRRLAELLDQLVLPEPPKLSAREERAADGLAQLMAVHGMLDMAYLGKCDGGLEIWDAHSGEGLGGCCWDASWARQWPSDHQPVWLAMPQPREELRDVAQRLLDDGLRPVPAGFAA